MTILPDKYPEDPFALNNFGIYHLNVEEAAILIAKCLFLDGGIKAEYTTYDGISIHAPGLEKALEKHILEMGRTLINGIKQGTLKADQISRTLNELIIPEETYIENDVLIKWLEERNIYITGDWYQEYADEQIEIMGAVVAAIEIARAKYRNPKIYEEYKRTHENDDAFTQHVKIAELQSELKHYRERPKVKPEKPLSKNERGTLLEIILGMAVDKYGYDASNPDKKSGVPKAISDSLFNAEIANPPTAETIRKKLRAAAGLEEEN